jgi:hypothetical protein
MVKNQYKICRRCGKKIGLSILEMYKLKPMVIDGPFYYCDIDCFNGFTFPVKNDEKK